MAVYLTSARPVEVSSWNDSKSMQIFDSGSHELWLEKVRCRLATGALMAYPTETFYALGCDPHQIGAVARLVELKGRQEDRPLPLIAASLEDARQAVELGAPRLAELWRGLTRAFWPGGLTLVVPARKPCALPVMSSSGCVGIRVSALPLARQLAAAAGGLLVATSANRAGHAPARRLAELGDLAAGVDLGVAAGVTPGGLPSTVLDLTGGRPRLLRPGVLPAQTLSAFLGGPILPGG